MSLETLVSKIQDERLKNENLSVLGNCWNATCTLANLAQKVEPNAKVAILRYSQDASEKTAHYALLVTFPDERILFVNPIKAPGFPVHIGEIGPQNYGSPLISEMEQINIDSAA